eukprot:Sspe_Gene.88008::Locus_60150_Transcript_1_1_Confidence_1.000_Length_891::g.88008::m.88008
MAKPIDYSKFDKVEVSDDEKMDADSPKKKGPPAEKLDDDGEKLSWYKHREWKPSPENAAPSPTPVRVDSVQSSSPPATSPSQVERSQWNTACTWEERNMIEWAKEKLTSRIVGLVHPLPGFDSELKVTKLSVEGDATVSFIRGKKRFLFDMKLELTVTASLKDDTVKGVIEFPEFANDEDPPYTMSFKWKEEGKVKAEDKEAVSEAIGAKSSKVSSKKGLCYEVHGHLADWIKEFHTL